MLKEVHLKKKKKKYDVGDQILLKLTQTKFAKMLFNKNIIYQSYS